jgi:hypothetical protein
MTEDPGITEDEPEVELSEEEVAALEFEQSEEGEQERLERTAAMVEAENAAAPSAEEVKLLYQPPKIEPVGEDNFRMTKWVVGDDGTPTLVELDL